MCTHVTKKHNIYHASTSIRTHVHTYDKTHNISHTYIHKKTCAHLRQNVQYITHIHIHKKTYAHMQQKAQYITHIHIHKKTWAHFRQNAQHISHTFISMCAHMQLMSPHNILYKWRVLVCPLFNFGYAFRWVIHKLIEAFLNHDPGKFQQKYLPVTEYIAYVRFFP